MARARVVMLQAGSLSFALGTLISLTTQATVAGCSAAQDKPGPTQLAAEPPAASASPAGAPATAAAAPVETAPQSAPAAATSATAHSGPPIGMPRFMGATKAGPIMLPITEEPPPRASAQDPSRPSPSSNATSP